MCLFNFIQKFTGKIFILLNKLVLCTNLNEIRISYLFFQTLLIRFFFILLYFSARMCTKSCMP